MFYFHLLTSFATLIQIANKMSFISIFSVGVQNVVATFGYERVSPNKYTSIYIKLIGIELRCDIILNVVTIDMKPD